MKKINRIGQRYGQLVVLWQGPTRKKHCSWICKCDCGNTCVVDSGNLASGHTTSCGHCEKYIKVSDSVVRCVLKDGQSFIISIEDYDKCSKHKWSIEQGSGYPHTVIDGKNVRLHRYIMGDGKWQIDHINGNKADNRRENLRIVNNQQNHWNTKIPKSNTSGYKGVSLDSRRNKYEAGITVDGRRRFLGYFSDPREAAKAYDRAASFYFGQYARLNFNQGGNQYGKNQEILEMEERSA